MSQQRDFERLVAHHISSEGVAPPSDAFHDELLGRARRTGQRPEWLAFLKESPMRTDSRLSVGSPTFRVAAILVATLLLAVALVGAGIAGSRLLATDDTFVVDQAGAGDFRTITEAVAAAPDGHTILIRPGVYTESILIGKDVILKGEARDQVILKVPTDGPTFDGYWYGPDQYGILIEDSAAEVSGLTIQGIGGEDGSAAMTVVGGSPLIRDVATDEGSWMAVYFFGAAGGTLRDSSLQGVVFARDGSAPTIENNDILWQVAVENPVGTERAHVKGNRLAGVTVAPYSPSGAWIGDGAGALIEGNQLRLPDRDPCCGPDHLGIHIINSQGTIARDNDVAGFAEGIAVRSGSSNVIEANTLTDNRSAINVASGDLRIEGNVIQGGRSGIVVVSGAPEVIDNTVSGVSGRGIALGGSGSPTLLGNRSCDNGENLWVGPNVDVDIDSNEICEDARPSPAG